MKMTKGRLSELEEIKNYIPDNCKWEETTDEHIKMYFDKQERGVKVDHRISCRCGFCAIEWGRIWRDRIKAMHKEGI